MSGTLIVDAENGTTSQEDFSGIVLGNDKPAGTDKNSTGYMRMYSSSGHRGTLFPNTYTGHRDYWLPDKSGIIALTDDLIDLHPIRVTQSVNFTNLADHDTVNTPDFTIPKTGMYIVTFSMAQCGATDISQVGAFWQVELIDKSTSGHVYPTPAIRQFFVLPVGNAWDSAVFTTMMFQLSAGDYYVIFKNYTGVTTNAMYGSTGAVSCFYFSEV